MNDFKIYFAIAIMMLGSLSGVAAASPSVLLENQKSALALEEFLIPITQIRGDIDAAMKQQQRLVAVRDRTPEKLTTTASEKFPTKNRPRGILAHDHALLVSDGTKYNTAPVPYLNGNLVTIPHSPFSYIATQAPLRGPLPQFNDQPLDDTIPDLFNVLIEKDTTVLVSMVMHKEPKMRKAERVFEEKSSDFWDHETDLGKGFVLKKGIEITLPKDIQDKIVAEQKRSGTDQGIVIRALEITKDGKPFRIITQYHYLFWPDHGTPNDEIYALFEMLINARLVADRNEGRIGPLAAHCSAGRGRTGIFLACRFVRDYVESQLAKGISKDKIMLNLPEMVLLMNSCRFLLDNLSDSDQYNFVLKWIEGYVRSL